MSAIEKGECLQDVHIAPAHTMLQQQFPDRAGFQSTLHVANGRCIPQKEGTIQMHFDEERKHWLTSSFIGRRVHIFDSRYTGFIPDGVKEQMRAIYSHLSKQLSAQVVRVQQQQGATDCGLYAIAYAVHMANGDDPAKAKFEQKKMRSHFLDCLKNKKLEAFPVEKNYQQGRSARDNQTLRDFCSTSCSLYMYTHTQNMLNAHNSYIHQLDCALNCEQREVYTISSLYQYRENLVYPYTNSSLCI